MWYPGSRLAAYKEQQRESKYKKKIMCSRPRCLSGCVFVCSVIFVSSSRAAPRGGAEMVNYYYYLYYYFIFASQHDPLAPLSRHACTMG